ncbi:gluconokinase [Phormidium yuhuli AB48]|uniref:Gluconokinase n=1 Tax=Phormidium yuhuli AB48 TaxID=2940671 RepID=A0ABY5AMZ7_9CYAN|nr:gluconokinase [Phormidium yuhuli]USR89726.1 gluconokinase [Phormidium yuhuli AB48]
MSKSPVPVVIVMGVSGCGKTTVAQGLAERLGWRFLEGDRFHPQANVAKMTRGIPLEDDDRVPWLQELGVAIAQARRESQTSGTGIVVACSALKQAYRDQLMLNQEPFLWLYLRGEFELLRQRLETRSDHFMPAQLLASQFAALEEPQEAITLDCGRSPQDLIADTLKFL